MLFLLVRSMHITEGRNKEKKCTFCFFEKKDCAAQAEEERGGEEEEEVKFLFPFPFFGKPWVALLLFCARVFSLFSRWRKRRKCSRRNI